MNKNRKLINALLVSTMMLSGLALDVSAADSSVKRLDGDTRVETSVKVSNEVYASADTVVLAGYNGEVDALTGTILASLKDAPLLLVSEKEKDFSAIKAEITKLGAKNVVLLGDTKVISKSISDDLKALNLNVSRVAGDDRFDTAIEVAKEAGAKHEHVFLTNDGRSGELADALATGPVSGRDQDPILLTSQAGLPSQTIKALEAMDVKRVTIVGGDLAVSNVVKAELENLGIKVSRVAGDNRWETAEKIANTYFSKSTKAILANDGRFSYADALVGGYLGAKHEAPILLTLPNQLNEATENYLGSNASFVYVLGGPKAVGEKAVTAVEEIINNKTVSITDVKAVNAKTIEVTFDKAVEDTSKATVELLRGTFKQNATVKWSEDKKSMTLEVPGTLQNAEYTVNVTGLDDEVLSGSVKVEAQKVASIEILDDLAVIDSDGKKATVTYVVKDQYGDDITEKPKFKVTSGNAAHTINGNTIEIPIDGNVKENSKVAVVLIHKDTGVTATKTVTISKASAVTDIAVKGIYDTKGKEVVLNEDTKGTHYLVLDLKDQYGNKIVDTKTVEKMLVTNTNNEVLKLAENPTVLKIGEENEAVLAISDVKKAGSTKAILISSSNGKTAQYDIVVEETTRTDAVSVTSPEFSVLGADILLPLSVTDKTGETITDIKILADTVKGVKVTGGEVVVIDGKSYVKAKYPTDAKAGDYHTVLVQTSTNKTDTVTFKLEAEAVPTIITGVKNPLVVKGSRDITATDLIVKDQYGRDVKSDKIGNFTVEQVNKDSKVLSVAGNKITGIANGTDKVEIKLANKEDSAIVVEVQVTDGKEFKSYEVADLGLLNANVEAGNELKVSGILANDGKVKLTKDDYLATTNVKGLEVVDGRLQVKVSGEETFKENLNKIFTVDGKAVSERDVKVTFTINNDGTKVEQTYKLSNKAPQVQEFFFTKDDSVDTAKEYVESHIVENNFNKEDLLKVLTTDQYGTKEITTIGDAPMTIVPAKVSEVKITGNGTNAAEAELVSKEIGAKSELTVKVNIGNATKEIKISLVNTSK